MLHTHTFRRLTALSAATLVALGAAAPAFAQNATQASFELRPYCEGLENDTVASGGDGGGFAGGIPDIPGIINPDMNNGSAGNNPSNCRSFDVQSPSMLKTATLKQGDVLDLHLVLNNPQKLPVSRLRAWLVYDPSVLRGDSVVFGKKLPVPTPGESEFSAAEGYAKIGVSAASGQEPIDDPLVVAHVKFTVLSTPYTSTVISFYDAQGTPEGHTFAMNNAGGEHDILTSTLPSLLVQLDQAPAEPPLVSSAASSSTSVAPASASSEATSAFVPSSAAEISSAIVESSSSSFSSDAMSSFSEITSASSSSEAAAMPSPTFSLLQPQNLRVTTDGGAVYLAWDPLPSAELVGYNIYYGTISGNYLQKRSIDRSATNLTLRGLPEGQTYYFALRGDNGKGEETQFGQEVAVTVGNPATSTAPLSASVFTTPGPRGKPPATGGQIGGETGLPSPLVLFFIGSAVIGTVLAFRRQWTARAELSHG